MRPPEEQIAALRQGAVDLVTEEDLLARLRLGRPLRVKLGLDPTAPDLHLGHTVVLRKLRQFQDLGHEAHLIIGDFTGRIGDPTGRNSTRPPLTEEQIQKNAETYKAQAFKVLDRERTKIRFNSEWLGKLAFGDVVQLAAKYTVARLLERDDFKKRYQGGTPISVHELLYPLAQAYDSVAIEADVELGGTDQLFNLLVGREILRDYQLPAQVVLTTPILEGTDAKLEGGKIVGDKMSKSLGNFVGITEPPGEIFGKVMSIADAVMWRYYDLLSQKSADEVRAAKAGHPMEAKKALAREMVARFHSEPAAAQAQADFERVFSRREDPESIEALTFRPLDDGAPALVAVLAGTSLAKSRSDARRLVEQGAVEVDGQRVSDGNLTLARGKSYRIRVGKRRFAAVKIGG